MVDRINQGISSMKINQNNDNNQGDEKIDKLNQKQVEARYQFNNNTIAGNGTFGVVYKAIDVQSGQTVAIKRVFQDRRYKNREYGIIRELDHPYVIKLRDAFYTQAEKPDEVYLNCVMDYVPETLYRISKYYRKQKQQFPNILVKLYAYQMFRSIAYINGLGICHRDIKPQNMLVDPQSHILKLCDFGSAKKFVKDEPNVSYICSRYYRAPELIFGDTFYTFAIDIWSIGCVIAELLLNEPIFPGESAVDQLVEIIKVLGTPTREQVNIMNPNYQDFKFPNIKAQQLNKVIKKADPLAIDLLSKILVYEPHLRLKPLEALLHPYFNELRNKNCKINDKTLLELNPNLFNFSKEEIQQNQELKDRLIPSWYKEMN